MIKKYIFIFVSILSLSFAVNGQAASQKVLFTSERFSSERTSSEKQRETCVPIGKGAAMNAAAQRTNGKVLGASLNTRSRPPTYRVKVLTESGRVRHIYVHACNGRVLG